MSTDEISGDITMRELIDRCLRAETQALLLERQVMECRQGMRAAMRAKTLEKARDLIEKAQQHDMTLEFARP